MPNYTVSYEGKDYDVTAADERQAWAYAKKHVANRAAKRQELETKYKVEDTASGMLDPTSGMSGYDKVMSNIGAGASDVMLGAKQLFGQASGEDAREKKRIDDYLASKTTGGKALQLLGAAAPAVATAIPFGAAAATVGGGMALGGAAGLLAPTEDDNLVRGKLLNTSLGAVTGGLGNKLIPLVAPAVRRGTEALRQGAQRFTQGGRQRLAEDTFKRQFDDPQRALDLLRSHRDVAGAAPTTAQILNDPAMLSTERRLADTGGEAAQALLGRRTASNEARNELLRQELGGNVGALEREASQFAQSAKPQLFDKNFNQRPVIGELTRLQNNTNSDGAKAALEAIKENVRAALKSNNPLEQLHQVRMYQIDDAMSRLSQTDSKLAGAMRRELQSVKAALDLQLDKSTNGQWSQFLQGYSTRATARDQGQAGAALMERLGQVRPDNAGNPMLTSARQNLRKEVGAVDDFGKPVYSPGGGRAIDDVVRSLDVESRVANVRPAGSATAANLGRGAAQASDAALRPLTGQVEPPGLVARAMMGLGGGGTGATLGATVGGAPGAWVGGALGGIVGQSAQRFGQAQSLDIARRLFQMHLDPQAAIQVLQQAVAARQITQQQASTAIQLLRRLGSGASPLAPGSQVSVPQQAGQTLADMLTRHGQQD